MFEVVPLEVDVPRELAPLEEVESIVNELVLGESLRERAMFRLWRLWKAKGYLNLFDEGSESVVPMFSTFEEFLSYFCQIVDVSRAKIFSRIKTYNELEWLGFSETQMLHMMSNRPGLYSKALGKIIEWDSQENEPESLKTDFFGDPSDPESAKETIKEFVEELALHDSVTGALEMLNRDVLGRPEVSIFMSGDCMIVRFEAGFVTENGHDVLEEIDEIVFEGDTALPMWARTEMERKYRIKTI